MSLTVVDPGVAAGAEAKRGHRDRTYAARRAMVTTFAAVASSDRAGRCGRVRGEVDGDKHRDVVHVSGFESCGLGHLCPTCSVAPRLRRRLEIALAVQRWMARDRLVVMVTFALPHGPHDRLDVLLDRLWQTWRVAVHDTAQGRRWKKGTGLAHIVRTTEVTFHRDRGRHPHMHVLLFLDVPPSEMDYPDFRFTLRCLTVPLWQRFQALTGLSSFMPSAGFDVTEVSDPFAADYLTKLAGEQGVDREVVSMGTQKDGRNGSIDAMAIPYALAEYGTGKAIRAALEADNHAQWLARSLVEYRRATAGREMIGFSKGLRSDLLPDVPEMSDQDLIRCAGRLRDEYRSAVLAGTTNGSLETPIDLPEGDDEVDPEAPGKEDEDVEPSGVSVDPTVYSAWARRLGDQYLPADAMFARRWEQDGLWRWVLDVAYAWEKTTGSRVKVHQHKKTGRLKVGNAFAEPGSSWVEVSSDVWVELAERYDPKKAVE